MSDWASASEGKRGYHGLGALTVYVMMGHGRVHERLNGQMRAGAGIGGEKDELTDGDDAGTAAG